MSEADATPVTVQLAPKAATRAALVFWAIAALFVVALAAVQMVAQSLLVVFAAVLFGTGLRGLAEFVARRFGMTMGWSLATCIVFVLLTVAALIAWTIPNLAEQSAMLADEVGHAYETLRRSAAGTPFSRMAVPDFSTVGHKLAQAAPRVLGILGSVVGGLGSSLFVLFGALFVATNPNVYRCGVLALVPPNGRDRAAKVLHDLASTLQRWLLGRAVSMTAVGLVTTIGLSIVGIPLPLVLGLLAGLLGFVPNVGPAVSVIPALLLALTISPAHVLYVAILYLGVNLGDGYGLTPWVQRRAVSLPPFLLVTAQLILGVLFGLLGLTLATPLAACVIVLTRELYLSKIENGPSLR